MEMPQVYRPIPRRTFEITPASTDSSHPPSPTPENMNPDLLMSKLPDAASPPSRTRSILNLTSSTLFGIYSPTGNEGPREEPSTPWGTGAQTPSKRRSSDAYAPETPSVNWNGQETKPRSNRVRKRTGFRGYWLPLTLQTALLFAFGVGYGTIITQVQKTQHIETVPIPAVARSSNYYHVVWGLFGILLGHGLLLVDTMYEDEMSLKESQTSRNRTRATRGPSETPQTAEQVRLSPSDTGVGPIWYSVVRSIGAFVGIAFAVRKVPWQSTLQVSLTLALANPVLWYLIDRSMTGFAFSTAVGLIGTFVLLLVNPNFVPMPAIHQSAASEQIGVYTWLASILFCTSLCFGAIGRKLRL